jgi:orotidine-5'-phosphate decarboxylase
MLNVHASGGTKMMQAAAEAARKTASAEGRPGPLVIAVTVLTSMTAAAMSETGTNGPVIDHVSRLARLAQESGLDGVVASPQETGVIRSLCGPGFAIVTPGIRGGAAVTSKDDQERTLTAGGAIAAGSSYLVVGRPVIGAPDPPAAAARIVEEIRAGSAQD